MLVERLRLRGFRTYEALDVGIGPNITVVYGANGAGKTNLLEGLYFGCTGRSCRTSNEREVVRFGAPASRVEVELAGGHMLSVGFEPGQPKRFRVDGAPVERLTDAPDRPLVGVFLPERLELVKGAPGVRRAHLDQLVAALWPARAATRRDYAHALAQRNALLSRIRAGRADRDAIAAWDGELARHGIALRDDRARTADLLAAPFTTHAADLGLRGTPALTYRPRTSATTPEELVEELRERLDSDLDRGFSGHGPHRDDLVFSRDARSLRSYGSQGEQRIALLALLLAERDALAAERAEPPLLLLDDVMSELDETRRGLLVERLAAGGQSVITTTELTHVPGAGELGAATIAVSEGAVVEGAAA